MTLKGAAAELVEEGLGGAGGFCGRASIFGYRVVDGEVLDRATGADVDEEGVDLDEFDQPIELMVLVEDNGPIHTSKPSLAALAAGSQSTGCQDAPKLTRSMKTLSIQRPLPSIEMRSRPRSPPIDFSADPQRSVNT